MTVNKNYGQKKPSIIGKRISAGQKRRAAQGLPVGRKRTAVTYRFECEVCGKLVEDKHGNTKRVACSQKHGQLIGRKRTKKLPSDEVIAELYLSGLSGQEIAAMYMSRGSHRGVYDALRRAGVKLRPSGPRTVLFCVEDSCNEPVYKVWHSQLKGFYGKRCKHHHEERIKFWSKQRTIKKKQQCLSKSL